MNTVLDRLFYATHDHINLECLTTGGGFAAHQVVSKPALLSSTLAADTPMPSHASPIASKFFDPYTRDTFKAAPRTHDLDGWRLEYMAISVPATAHCTPIVIIGGAFQNFNSYKYCVEQLLQAGPIILIDLPSMGSNQQLANAVTGASADTLELPQLAGFLGRWVHDVGLHKVSIMGMSLGSVIAAHFAEQFPALTERMVLMGVMQKTRKSWRMLLEESLHLMRENRMDEFGQAVVLYLVNHAKLHETRLSPTAKRLFYKQMADFAHTERERYNINCHRLLRLAHVPAPQCPVLVASGEFDSFTLPFENAHFALQCPDMQFAVIKHADHLPQLERRKETMALFAAFLAQKNIAEVEGIEVRTREQLQNLERRSEPRLHLVEPVRQMRHRHANKPFAVEIKDINFFGVCFTAQMPEHAAQLMQEPRDLAVHVGQVEGEDVWLECLMFEQHSNDVRALFKHGSFLVAEQLNLILASDAILENLTVEQA